MLIEDNLNRMTKDHQNLFRETAEFRIPMKRIEQKQNNVNLIAACTICRVYTHTHASKPPLRKHHRGIGLFTSRYM